MIRREPAMLATADASPRTQASYSAAILWPFLKRRTGSTRSNQSTIAVKLPVKLTPKLASVTHSSPAWLFEPGMGFLGLSNWVALS